MRNLIYPTTMPCSPETLTRIYNSWLSYAQEPMDLSNTNMEVSRTTRWMTSPRATCCCSSNWTKSFIKNMLQNKKTPRNLRQTRRGGRDGPSSNLPRRC